MIELLFFVIAVLIVRHYLHQLAVGRPAKVGSRPAGGELKQMLEYAEKLYLEKKYLSAEKVYLKVLKLDHKHAQAYRRLGLIYAAQKNYDEAIESFQIAAHLDASATNYFNLGVAFFENVNYIKALAAFEKGLIFDNNAELQTALGKTHLKLNHPSEAVSAFTKATEAKETKANLMHLAEALIEGGKREEAGEVYRKVLKIDPSDNKARRFLKMPASVS